MRLLGYLVKLGPDLYVSDASGAVVVFSETSDIEAVAPTSGATVVRVVRYRARRRRPDTDRPGVALSAPAQPGLPLPDDR